jgi:hypothetical protein
MSKLMFFKILIQGKCLIAESAFKIFNLGVDKAMSIETKLCSKGLFTVLMITFENS